MSTNARRSRFVVFTTFVIFALGEIAMATASEGSIEEIVVTARKRAESLQEVPVAVTAFSEEDMKRQNIQEFVDLQAQLPGVYISQVQADPSIARIVIRGQAQADMLLTTDASVGVYVDGVNLPRQNGLNANMFDIERVEVLRGPQGTLYGRNTTGGAINVITRKADYEGVRGYLRGTAGNESFTQFAGALNIPLAESAAVRLAAQKTDQDGFGKSNFTGDDLYDQDEVFFRGSLTWDPTARLNVQLQADYMDLDEGGAAEKLLQPGGNILNPGNTLPITPSIVAGIELGAMNPADIPSAANPIPGPTFIPGLIAGYEALSGYTQGDLLDSDADADVFSKATLWGGGLTISYDLNDTVEFKSITGYRNWKTERLLDLDGTPFTILHPLLAVDADIFTQELQLLGSTGNLDWVVGGFYSNEEGTDGSRTLAVRPLNPTRNVTDGDVTNKSWALFAQGTYALTEALNLTAGFRWTEEKKALVNMNRLELADIPGFVIACRVPPANLPVDACATKSSDSFEDPSWLVSLDYAINEQVMGYASISRSWRGGGQNLRADGADVAAAQPFEPETALNYEVGLKGDFFDSRLRTNVAVYLTDYEDVQRSIIVPGSASGSVVTVLTNAAEAEITGLELEAWLYPTDNLTIFGTVGYLDFEYKDFESFAQDGVTIVDRSGEDVGVPELQYSLSARYDAPIGNNRLGIQIDYAWVDDINTNPTSTVPDVVTQDSHGLLNSRVDFEIAQSDLILSLWGRNLTDETIIAGTTDFTGNLGHTIGHIGRPRQYGLTVTWNLGQE